MIKNNKKGFTLIELLVVIAIIGILSGTVIVSMSGAQDSAKNARIEAGMDQLRSVAEVYRLLHGNKYSSGTNNNFSTEGDGLLIKQDIEAAGGTFSIGTPTATAYCMSSKLNGSSDLYLCMDSTGKVTRSATAICSGITCP
ncbi:MAG: type II secretion system protein [Atribacterota bacterium]|nr:type II secretion system protein [Atribacterota bacterium]